MGECEVVGLCDVSGESIERVQERHREQHPHIVDVPVFEDYQEMLDKVEMDAVEISTPHTLHFEQIVAALDKGLHVLTEKPMVCTVDHAHQVIDKAEETGKVLMISYQRHLGAQYRFVRNQIMAGELGEIQFISALQDQQWYQGTIGLWRQKLSLSGGGQLNDSGSHLLDIVLWMTGLEVVEVPGVTGYLDTNYEGKAEYALAILEREYGAEHAMVAPTIAGATVLLNR